MGDAKAVAGPLPVPTQVAAQAAAETFKKSRRDRSFFIPASPFRFFRTVKNFFSLGRYSVEFVGEADISAFSPLRA
jgi:hypothetical protein